MNPSRQGYGSDVTVPAGAARGVITENYVAVLAWDELPPVRLGTGRADTG